VKDFYLSIGAVFGCKIRPSPY